MAGCSRRPARFLPYTRRVTQPTLTSLAKAGGCAAKYSAARLEELLAGIVPADATDLLVGLDPAHLEAKPVSIEGDKVSVEGTLTAGGNGCATCRGTFVAVKPGHPAYHRW